MANEAYRAVFLRIHPTGKMVLSLTTEADGNEERLRAAGRRRARRAAARRQGRARRHQSLRRGPRLQHGSLARRPRGDREHDGQDPRQGAAARRRRRSAPRRRASSGATAPSARRPSRPRWRRSPTWRCTRSPAASCRPGSRVGSTPRPCTETEPNPDDRRPIQMVELDHSVSERQADRLQLGRDPRPRPR